MTDTPIPTEWFVREMDPGMHVNEYGTTITSDTTETYDVEIDQGDLVVHWCQIVHSFDGRGERNTDYHASTTEIMRLNPDGATWLRAMLDRYLADPTAATMHDD